MLHRGNLFLVGLMGAGKIDARPPARAPSRTSASSTPTTSSRAARRDDPDDLRDRGRGGVPRPRGSGARRARASSTNIVLAHRRRRGPRARRIASACTSGGTVVYLHADAGDAVRAHAPRAATGRCCNAADPRARARRALRAARPAVSRGRRPRRSNRTATSVMRFARALRGGAAARARGAVIARMKRLDVALGERSYPIHDRPRAARATPARCSPHGAGAARDRRHQRDRRRALARRRCARRSRPRGRRDATSCSCPTARRTRTWRRCSDRLTRLLELQRRARDRARRARRRRRRRPRGLRGRDLPARHAVRAGADDAARAGRLVGRRQDRRSTIRSART